MEVRDRHRAHRTIAVLAAVCVVLQLSLAPQISVFGGTVNFLMVLAGAVALSYGSSAGVVCGFLAGLLYDLTTPVPAGLMMLVLTVGGFALGYGGRNRVAESYASSLKVFGGFALAANVVYGIGLFLTGVEGSILVAIFGHGVVCAVLTTLVAALVLLALSGAEGPGGFSAKGAKGTRFRRSR